MPSIGAVPAVPPAIERAIARALEKEPIRPIRDGRGIRAGAGDVGDVDRRRSRRRAVVARLSIAVLPIVNIGGDAENEYFSDGMTEELTNALAKVEGLRVVSRTSTFTFKGKQVALGEIGRQLDVGFVLEGSVRRAGNRLRLAAKLIRVSDDSPLWAETYERTMDDVFAVQDDISRRIVETITETLQLGHLRGNTAVQQGGKHRGVRPVSARPLSLVHSAPRRVFGSRSSCSSRRSRRIPTMRRHTAASPTRARCSPRGTTRSRARCFRAPRPRRERAIALDDRSADAHASLGFVKYNYEWDWAGAERALRRAIELNPEPRDGASVALGVSRRHGTLCRGAADRAARAWS